MKQKISLIVPCYNEGEGIEKFYSETMKTINKIREKYEQEKQQVIEKMVKYML